MAKPPLENGEQIIDSWTLNFMPTEGGRYTGDFYVTDKKVFYDAKFDMSFRGILKEAAFVQFGSEGHMTVPRDGIERVEVKKSFFKKSIILHLKDGTELSFNYGMLSVDKIAAALS